MRKLGDSGDQVRLEQWIAKGLPAIGGFVFTGYVEALAEDVEGEVL